MLKHVCASAQPLRRTASPMAQTKETLAKRSKSSPQGPIRFDNPFTCILALN
jgi:hypothetical protein